MKKHAMLAFKCPSYRLGNFSKLIFANNSVYQGGTIYVIPLSLEVEVLFESSTKCTKFVHNTTTDVGVADLESDYC